MTQVSPGHANRSIPFTPGRTAPVPSQPDPGSSGRSLDLTPHPRQLTASTRSLPDHRATPVDKRGDRFPMREPCSDRATSRTDGFQHPGESSWNHRVHRRKQPAPSAPGSVLGRSFMRVLHPFSRRLCAPQPRPIASCDELWVTWFTFSSSRRIAVCPF